MKREQLNENSFENRYYAGPGNHFYKLLYESGLIPRFVDSDEDAKLLDYGIGLVINIILALANVNIFF